VYATWEGGGVLETCCFQTTIAKHQIILMHTRYFAWVDELRGQPPHDRAGMQTPPNTSPSSRMNSNPAYVAYIYRLSDGEAAGGKEVELILLS